MHIYNYVEDSETDDKEAKGPNRFHDAIKCRISLLDFSY
jgi:hypothetical protein